MIALKRDSKQHIWSHIETVRPVHRAVMLGASNLSRSFPTAVSTALRAFGRPIAVLAAKGHGRSYGKVSSFFGKKISGISRCGIWNELAAQDPVPTTAWITDIGNDLAYEIPVDTVIGWVELCLDHLLSVDATVVVSDLPLDVLRRLSAVRYRLLRSIFFPTCRLSLYEMRARAEQLSKRLHELAKSRKTTVFSGCNGYYGFDPIHPRRSTFAIMWREMFAAAGAAVETGTATADSPWLNFYLRGLRPQNWSSYSTARTAMQPNGRLSDGTTISLY